MTGKTHQYKTRLVWDGNRGDGTSSYATYGRDYRLLIDGKEEIQASADAMFKGDGTKPNPEDLFVAAISSCHLLTYLALCARNGISVSSYEDDAEGTLSLTADGGGKFDEVVLHPRVVIASGDGELAKALHEKAHQLCFIANSCSVPIRNEPRVTKGQVN